jgi:hypothetical protein
MAPPVEGFVYLRDQRRLTPAEMNRGQAICAYGRRIVVQRDAYLALEHLDAAIYRPDGLWRLWDGSRPPSLSAEVPVDAHAYSSFASGGRPMLIEHIRVLARIVTGNVIDAVLHCETAEEMERVLTGLDREFEKQAPYPDLWVRLYQDALCGVPEVFTFGPPPMLGEVGWVVNSTIVTRSTYAALERLALNYEAGFLDRETGDALMPKSDPTIVEIGAGYGGLAYYLLKLLPQTRYIIVDLPETLLYSSLYLSLVFPNLATQYLEPDSPGPIDSGPGVTFVPNYMFQKLHPETRADLVINTLSMSEMAEAQVRAYCVGISGMIGQAGAFFEQNQDNRPHGLLNAMDVIGEHFPRRNTLTGRFLRSVTEGTPNVWRT